MLLNAHDPEVIAACQQGDHDAFSALFEAYKDRVYSIALRFAGDSASAMDITQDTFLKLLSRIRDFRGESSFDSWLYRLVVNSCLDHQRKRRKWLPFLDSFANALRVAGETAFQHRFRTEIAENVQRGLHRLSPEHRIVVVLRYTEGLSYDQIAAILGLSTGTVASRLNRAHKLLERHLSHLRESLKNGRPDA